ncbi:MAG: cytosolic protein, partial [Anaerolineales bacterium]
TLGSGHLPFAELAAIIRRVGPATTVAATDFGQPENVSPVDGLALFVAELQAAGFTRPEVDLMVRTNPARLLEL